MSVGTSDTLRPLQAPARPPLYGTREFYIAKLEEALAVADGKPLTFPALLERLRSIWTDEKRLLVLDRFEGIELTSDQQEQLAETLICLVDRAKVLPSRDRDRVDRAVSRLVRRLSPERAWTIVEPWFEDRRAFRRGVVHRVLLERGVPPNLAPALMEQYRSSRDRGMLRLIASSAEAAALFDEGDLREALTAPDHTREILSGFVIVDTDARYWRMRAFELLLIGGRTPSETTVLEYPNEFVWAVGRRSHRESLPLLRRLLEHYRDDPEIVWRCIRALDRMGEQNDRDNVRVIAQAILGTGQTGKEAA